VTAPRSATPAAGPSLPGATGLTHACVRCGRPVAIEKGLCERCNPLGLRDSSASQVHGLAIGGVVAFVIFMAIVARFALAGVGPFDGTVTNVATEGSGLAVTLNLTNHGKSAGQTTCRISDPADRTGNLGGFMLSPQVGPGQSVSFTQSITALGTTVRPLVADCKSP
jgi:hypothetical protein